MTRPQELAENKELKALEASAAVSKARQLAILAARAFAAASEAAVQVALSAEEEAQALDLLEQVRVAR